MIITINLHNNTVRGLSKLCVGTPTGGWLIRNSKSAIMLHIENELLNTTSCNNESEEKRMMRDALTKFINARLAT